MTHASETPARPILAQAEAAIRLVRMDLFPVAMPLARPMKMSGVTIRHAENLFVRLEAADGSIGWGEAASAPTMTGETLWGMTAAAELIWDALKGCDARLLGEALRRIENGIYGNPSAKSAVEMALLDLLGKARGISVGDILGTRLRDTLEPMWMLGNATPKADAAEARAKYEKGYRFFKLKVGTKAIENDIAAVLGVRDAIGPDARLCADANGGLSLVAARRLIEETRQARLFYLEQPLPAPALGDLAQLNRLGVVPIGIDEGIHSSADIEAHAARGAAAGISLKLIKLGGMIATLECAARAIELGLAINVAAKVAESSLASAAASHVAAAITNFDWGLSLTQVYLEHDPVLDSLPFADGAVPVPRGPGLGVTVDEDALRAFQVPVPR
ncbi:mandelate racemase/muconate lactonizing enzyme family protein [Xanthobacter pseudotagetidis]|uniref:mandelate racemase/muconate lactonizing enzyme family protein n=1 Tax=Xanthobacter pseudotagetidis TaxID=3119911 RepID=UPI00372A4F81